MSGNAWTPTNELPLDIWLNGFASHFKGDTREKLERAARACASMGEQSKNTTPPFMSKHNGNCCAVLWIHSHHETGEPLQIDVLQWNGRVDVLEQLADESKMGDLDFSALHCEDWLHVRVEYSREDEDTEYSLRLFPLSVIAAKELHDWHYGFNLAP